MIADIAIDKFVKNIIEVGLSKLKEGKWEICLWQAHTILMLGIWCEDPKFYQMLQEIGGALRSAALTMPNAWYSYRD